MTSSPHRVCFVIVSVSERLAALNTMLESLRADPRWDAMDIGIFFQDPVGVAPGIKAEEYRVEHLIVVPDKRGAHVARVQLLQHLEGKGYDTYISMDDDMLLGPLTNYGPIVEKCHEPGVGLVTTNWAQSPALLEKKRLKMAETFTPQIMMYCGGGQAFSEEVATIMRRLPTDKIATFECGWAITAYVHGYVNLYYRGSVTLHYALTSGGMKLVRGFHPLNVVGAEWFRLRLTKKQDGTGTSASIPLDEDVLPSAHIRHAAMRRRLLAR